MNSWMNFIRGIADDLQGGLTLFIAVIFIGGSLGCGVLAYKHYRRQRRHRHSSRIGSRITGFAYVASAAIFVFIGLSLILASLG